MTFTILNFSHLNLFIFLFKWNLLFWTSAIYIISSFFSNGIYKFELQSQSFLLSSQMAFTILNFSHLHLFIFFFSNGIYNFVLNHNLFFFLCKWQSYSELYWPCQLISNWVISQPLHFSSLQQLHSFWHIFCTFFAILFSFQREIFSNIKFKYWIF